MDRFTEEDLGESAREYAEQHTSDAYDEEPDEETGCTAREMTGVDLARHVFELAKAMNAAYAAGVRKEVA